jgi:uncharacterized membrane protein YozB (DUF420 family)
MSRVLKTLGAIFFACAFFCVLAAIWTLTRENVEGVRVLFTGILFAFAGAFMLLVGDTP